MSLALEQQYLRRILQAPVYQLAQRTPLQHAMRLSQRIGVPIWLKREDLQPIFSFKLRGAYTRMYQLSARERAAGVIAASAGNHAQGVALSARQLGIHACIVMPCTTPQIKVEAVRELDAEVVLSGDHYDAANQAAQQLAQQGQLCFIHPFDDPWVIAGQGTIGMEILQDWQAAPSANLVRQQGPAPQAIYVPVGGGGLIAGIAAYCKAVNPQVQIIGVEPEDAASLHAALAAGERVSIAQAGLFADGVAVKQVGHHPFMLARRLVDRVVTVSTDALCAALRDIFEDTRSFVEPAGALAVAGIKKDYADGKINPNSAGLVAINSGANTNFERLGHALERAQLGSGEETLLAVGIAERPGSFLRFCQDLGPWPISEFNYRYADPRQAQIFVAIRHPGGARELLRTLVGRGYAASDLSHNELAKTHLRHLVGGHLAHPLIERVFRFQFPERPNALLEFLEALACRWNISLFHYRNHGAAYGRVLVGFNVPTSESVDFSQFLTQLNFPWQEESANPAYQRFLAHPYSKHRDTRREQQHSI